MLGVRGPPTDPHTLWGAPSSLGGFADLLFCTNTMQRLQAHYKHPGLMKQTKLHSMHTLHTHHPAFKIGTSDCFPVNEVAVHPYILGVT